MHAAGTEENGDNLGIEGRTRRDPPERVEEVLDVEDPVLSERSKFPTDTSSTDCRRSTSWQHHHRQVRHPRAEVMRDACPIVGRLLGPFATPPIPTCRSILHQSGVRWGVGLREGASRGRGVDAERRRDGHVDDLYGLPFARHAAIRYHIRPRPPGDGIAALSAAACSVRQAGLIVAGCRRESVK